MQTVNILGHNSSQFACSFQSNDRQVRVIGTRVAKNLPGFQFVIPMLNPGSFRIHEILVIHWLTSFPDTLRPAKIGYTTVSRNASPSKKEDFCRFSQILCKLLLLLVRHEAM